MATPSNVLILPATCETRDSPAVITPTLGSAPPLEISYAQLVILVGALQKDLACMGITTADSVAIVLPNGPEFVATFLAVVRQRGIAAPLAPDYKQGEFKDVFSRMQPSLVVMQALDRDLDDGSYLAAPCVQAALALGVRVALCRQANTTNKGVGEAPELGLRLLDIQGDASPATSITDAALFSRNDVLSEDKAVLLFTSGTTGAPKSVLLSHTNLLAAMRIIITNTKLSSSDRAFIITPLYHIVGLCSSLLATLFSGGSVVIPKSLPGAFWQQCNDYGITWFYAVPTIHSLLLEFAPSGGPTPSQLRFLRCGGSETPPDLYDRLIVLGVPLLESYGMTETAPAIFCNRLEEDGDTGKRRRGYYPIPDAVEVMILPSDGSGYDAGQNGDTAATLTNEEDVIGEICLRGESVMAGYTNDPEANNEAFFPNGLFRTGDLGSIQPGSYLKLVGRIKESINKGGTQIGPAEVENAAVSHRSVAEAACFRIADDTYGDEIGEPPSSSS